ncbi:hypothetical protein GCM10010372_11170 [Streptomyces tauricus]|nr:hypothetical protein GCM10010372_11170 [Streptomyces tauricus]
MRAGADRERTRKADRVGGPGSEGVRGGTTAAPGRTPGAEERTKNGPVRGGETDRPEGGFPP